MLYQVSKQRCAHGHKTDAIQHDVKYILISDELSIKV